MRQCRHAAGLPQCQKTQPQKPTQRVAVASLPACTSLDPVSSAQTWSLRLHTGCIVGMRQEAPLLCAAAIAPCAGKPGANALGARHADHQGGLVTTSMAHRVWMAVVLPAPTGPKNTGLQTPDMQWVD